MVNDLALATADVDAAATVRSLQPPGLPRPGNGRTAGGATTDSTRMLWALLSLGRRTQRATTDHTAEDALYGVIPRESLKRLLAALHVRDESTVRHSRRVAMLAVGMAQRLGWEGVQLKKLEIAALLHDIGKIGVPDHVLFKPGKLSTDEAELMTLHHDVGVDVLQACKVDPEVIDIVVQSHRYYNGTLDDKTRLSNDVHQGARILSVADAYDSLSTDQVYRTAKSHEEIMEILISSAGMQFDGNVVCALARWVEEDGLPFDRMTEGLALPAGGPSSTAPRAPETTLLHRIFTYLYTIESLYDGFYVVDGDYNVAVWNRGVEQLLGYSSKLMIGQNWSPQLLAHADASGSPLAEKDYPLRRAVHTRTTATTSVKLRQQSGSWVEVEVQTVPLFDDSGRFQGVAEIFRDLSRQSRRPQQYLELKLAATRDSLTSLANRGELEKQLTGLVQQFDQATEKSPFCVIFLDIDHFKRVNDDHDHAVGDQVLVETARLLQQETYSGELVGRYGGEEFVVLCPETALADGRRRAERLREAIGRLRFNEATDLAVTASFGVTEMEPGDTVTSVLRRADRALITSKERGRNRTTCLTSSGTANSDDAPVARVERSADPFVVDVRFHISAAPDVVVCKLGGFVDDHRARLVSVKSDRVVLRLGHRTLLGGWGRSDDWQPVELVVTLEPKDHRSAAGKSKAPVHVVVRPLGRVPDAETFQNRARRALQDLRAYLVAEG